MVQRSGEANSTKLAIGCGAGFASDRLDAAVELVERVALDWLVLECLGERTLAFTHRDRRADPRRGYDPLLERRMRALLPRCRARGTRLLSNMGAANPLAAAEATVAIARTLGLAGLRVAVLLGDEVTDLLAPDTPLHEGGTVGARGTLVGANAYLGCEALLPAIESGAEVILTGRVADPSLFLAPLLARFGWALDDWQRLAAGTVVGHLLECGMQVSGGYFADPGKKDVPDLARCGFPWAEVSEAGEAILSKTPGSGGLVNVRTVAEQLFYEVHDPTTYLTPDVVADFSTVRIEEIGPDRVRISGARGAPRPATLKVTVGFDGGFLAEAEISYAGPNAAARARLAGSVLEERMRRVHGFAGPLRIDLVGLRSLHATALPEPAEAEDVRLRAALRAPERETGELLLWEVEALLTCGPAGGGGYRGRIVPQVTTASASLPRERVRTRVEVFAA
ncbi:MAG: acyclic terpene utilization AtuA family protein [Geminicoccaceae bacterium]